MVSGIVLIVIGACALCSLMGWIVSRGRETFLFGFLVFPAVIAACAILIGCMYLIVLGVHQISGSR